MIFSKPAIDVEAQIDLLTKRGLIISDKHYAKSTLLQISYYRLTAYWIPFQSDKVRHIFKPNSRFESVIKLYEFDSELRTLLFDVIEHIEISLRCKLNYYLSLEKNPWWFEDPENFTDEKNYNQCLNSINQQLDKAKTETFILEHKRKYHSDDRRPPSWKTLEVLSLGVLSKMYGNLNNKLLAKDQIARDFGVANHTYLHSWLQTITQIRNICAHHGRLWNKNLPGRPKLLSKPPNNWIKEVPSQEEQEMIYVHLCCMKYLLNTINKGNNFTYRLLSLLKKYPSVDPKALGLKKNWFLEPLWSNKIDAQLTRGTLFLSKAVFLIRNALK